MTKSRHAYKKLFLEKVAIASISKLGPVSNVTLGNSAFYGRSEFYEKIVMF